MALIIGGIVLVSGAIGSLIGYSTTKAFGDSPSSEHATNLVNNQISARSAEDNTHELTQTAWILLITVIMLVIVIITIVKCVLNRTIVNANRNVMSNVINEP